MLLYYEKERSFNTVKNLIQYFINFINWNVYNMGIILKCTVITSIIFAVTWHTHMNDEHVYTYLLL